MEKMFPGTIRKISIFNASRVTSELPMSLLCAIRAVFPFPERISLSSELSYENDSVLYIIICPAGLGSEKYNRCPKYYITYQLEPTFILQRETYRAFLEGAIYNWDYSRKNVEYLRSYDKIKIEYISPGFTYAMTTSDIMSGTYIYSDHKKDIDVLFLGWDVYQRRKAIKNSLEATGLRILFVSDMGLDGMSQAIRRSKICLNIHSSEEITCLETVRLNMLLSNQACIVSEELDDPEVDIYRDVLYVVPYDKILNTCKELVKDPDQRKRLAIKSYQWYRNTRDWNHIVDFNALLPQFES